MTATNPFAGAPAELRRRGMVSYSAGNTVHATALWEAADYLDSLTAAEQVAA